VGLGMVSHQGRCISIDDLGKLASCARGALKVSPRQPMAGSNHREPLALSA